MVRMSSDVHSDLAEELLAAFDHCDQIAPLSDSHDLDLTDAYKISRAIADRRVARGERIVGSKIGFTNRSLWPVYGVEAPMWAPMYDTSVAAFPPDGVVTLPRLAEPRIEPEIAFKFAQAPSGDMDLATLAGTIEWMAHGIEIVTSPFPKWQFKLVDCTAAQALHGCFWYGTPRPMPDDVATLETFTLKMEGPRGGLHGHATDVLDGPLHALRYLLKELDRMPGTERIQAGDIVTTGTLTDAGPVSPGETWTTELSGIDLPGLSIHFKA